MVLSTEKLVVTVAHALRHKPEQYLLMLDSGGWTDLESVVMALRCRREWARLSCADLRQLVQEMRVRRFEIQGNQIRALYGHSLKNVAVGLKRPPPEFLWHGTMSSSLAAIRQSGLLPMGRKLVHLTSDRNYADEVAVSKDAVFRDETANDIADAGSSETSTMILTVRAAAAFESGIPFWQANEHVWLAEPIPARFVEWPDSR